MKRSLFKNGRLIQVFDCSNESKYLNTNKEFNGRTGKFREDKHRNILTNFE